MSAHEGVTMRECLGPHRGHELTVDDYRDGVNLVCKTCARAIAFFNEITDALFPASETHRTTAEETNG